jgi:hypothetical protein
MTGKTVAYKVFNNIMTETEIKEDFGTSDFMENNYSLYAEGVFNKPWCEFKIYESIYLDNFNPNYVLDTGFGTVDYYFFDDFMSLAHFLKGIDLTFES